MTSIVIGIYSKASKFLVLAAFPFKYWYNTLKNGGVFSHKRAVLSLANYINLVNPKIHQFQDISVLHYVSYFDIKLSLQLYIIQKS